MPVSMAIAITSSAGLLSSLAKINPKLNPNQGNPMPVKHTCQVIILKMYKLAQTPNMMMKRIRNKAMGLRMRTRKLETLGNHLAMAKPMQSGTIKNPA